MISMLSEIHLLPLCICATASRVGAIGARRGNHMLLINDGSRKLNCFIEGGSAVFPVTVGRDHIVYDLKEVIQSKRAPVFLKDIDPHALKLCKVDIDLETHNERFLRQLKFELNGEGVETLESWKKIGQYWSDQPPTTHLQIVVKVPPTDDARESLLSSPTSTGKRTNQGDPRSVLDRWRSKRIKKELPTIAELETLVDLPLSDEDKIPISPERMEALVSSPIEWEDVCTMSDVQLLFRPGYYNYPFDIFFTAVAKAPPTMGTESSFHAFWDGNVRHLLELLIPGGRSIRNNYQNTATACFRPDFAFLVSKFCPFRGVEKGTDNSDDPKKELADTIVWAYKPAPYVLGYYATGPDFTLVAISPPSLEQGHPVVRDIAHANLRLRADRIKNICRLINLAGLFQQLADIVRPKVAEFDILERDNGTIEIAGRSIIKVYNGSDKVERVNHLRKVYQLLQDKRVPHVDWLVRHFDTTVILSPRGISAPPENEQELLAALICVLEALEFLHKEPQIFHRDISWPNIIRQVDDLQRWIIINWEDAAVPPTKAASHSNPSPLVFEDGHGAEVDMWSVGELIIKCGALDLSSVLVELGRWMQDSSPSASEALGEIKKYELARHG